MEDKIKALIEKYEKYCEAWGIALDLWQRIEDKEGTKRSERYLIIYKEMAADLKQLLTTSQGNPERMV